MLTMTTARELALTLRLYAQGRCLRADIEGDRIVFTGGRDGAHSLAISVSSAERVQAHWAGYCENNTLRPVVGEYVVFPSGSSPTGKRRGKVVKVGPKRVTIEYRYKHGGQAKPWYGPITELTMARWDAKAPPTWGAR